MIFIGTIVPEAEQIIIFLRLFPGGGPAVKTSSITNQAMRRRAVIEHEDLIFPKKQEQALSLRFNI